MVSDVSFANLHFFFHIMSLVSKKYCIFATGMRNRFLLCFFFMLLFPLALSSKGRKLVWVIDPGHGGRDVGCEGSKAKEKDINLKVARRVAELVRANLNDVRVVMTRDTDRFLTLDQRCSLANQSGGDLFLSIHVNSAPEAGSVCGTETYYGPVGVTSMPTVEAARRRYQSKSELLAWELQKHYGLVGRPISRGVKRERYYVVLHTLMPSVLTEIGFISTPSEQEYMTSKAGQEEIAQCIFRGLKDYKQTVEVGRERRVLAQMRSTGGRVPGAKSGKVDTVVDVVQNMATLSDVNKAVQGSVEASSDTVSDSTPEPSPEPEFVLEELTFAIQIFSLKTKIPVNDRAFRGLKNVKIREKEGVYKYQCGICTDYETARCTLVEVRKLFPDAFMVAFLGDRQISTSDAQELYIRKK